MAAYTYSLSSALPKVVVGINYQATVEKVVITQTDALSQEIGWI